MTEKISKISIITNFNIDEKAKAASKVCEFLSKYPCSIYLGEQAKQRLNLFEGIRDKINFAAPSVLYHEVDLIIVLGGDGSILSAVRNIGGSDIPILGINLGRLGYMAELEMNDIQQLSKIFEGDYFIDERAKLEVTVFRQGKNLSNRTTALNDAVLSNGSIARMIDLELSEGENIITEYRADGLIFSTPTGSTAYSMSAGGPVIDPRVRCVCVTPICPHSLTAKPLIFSDDATLTVKNICNREKMLFLTLDGKINYEIYRGDTVKIKKSNSTAKLMRFNKCGFYKTLHSKMSVN